MWKNEWILILIMNVNQFSVMITILISISHAHAKVELDTKKKSPSNQRTLRHQVPQQTKSETGSESELLNKRIKRRISHSRELLQRLLGLSKHRPLVQKIGKAKAIAKKTTNAISTKDHLKKSQRITNLRKQLSQNFQVIPGKDFMRALASKVLAHSLTYRHMHGTKRNVTSAISQDTAMSSVQKETASKSKTKQRVLAPHRNDADKKTKGSSKKPNKHLTRTNQFSLEHSPLKRKHRFQYLTDLIYKVNRFYSKISNRNASQHGNVLHIPFKRREVTKLRKLFMSLIDKENVLHIKNTSLIGESSRSKLRSFVHLLNQLDKSHNNTHPGASGKRVTNLPFDVEIESHNTTRKDFVVWDDDQQDDSMRQNMVDYMNDRINDLGNRPYDVNDLLQSHRLRGNDNVCFRCRIPDTRVGAGYGTGAILSEETSTGYADEDFDVELDHLNKKIEHYVLGRKASPIINEYKEIEDSEKESEWNNVKEYSQTGGGQGKWWEKQIYATAEQGLEPENDGTERGYKYGAVSGTPPTDQRILSRPQQSQYEYNDLYDFSLINRAINGYV